MITFERSPPFSTSSADRPGRRRSHSLGGLLALALAERRPDLVAGVVAFCPPLYPDERTARERTARLGWLERQLATDGP